MLSSHLCHCDLHAPRLASRYQPATCSTSRSHVTQRVASQQTQSRQGCSRRSAGHCCGAFGRRVRHLLLAARAVFVTQQKCYKVGSISKAHSLVHTGTITALKFSLLRLKHSFFNASIFLSSGTNLPTACSTSSCSITVCQG